MQRRQILHAAVLAPLASAAAGVRAQPEPPIAAALRARVPHEGMGLAAAVVGTTGVQFAFAGQRSAADATPPDADARFEYGSISKTFTTLLLAERVLAKTFALDDPVEAVLGIRLRDSAGKPITWTDLATHRSGLPRLPANLKPPVEADPYAGYTAADLMAFLADWKPEVPRDSRWEYSNLGFGLLGHALALQAGRPFAALLRERVLAPLQLDEIQVALTGQPLPGLLQGHDAKRQPVPRWQFDAMAGAGALVGSTRSLARYAQAAAGLIDTPLKPAFELALTPRAAGPSAANRIGLAWLFGPLNGRIVANHDGGTFGFSTSLFVDREARRAALVMANAMVVVNDLALHAMDPSVPLRDAAADAAKTQRPAVAVEPAALQLLTGSYALNPQFKLAVRLRDGRLFAQASGQGEFELFAMDARRWFARVTALEIHFEGESGLPPAFVLHQGGQKLRFVRE
jgi:serine-type D-Ala-D-Ala carboxypeptidase/endopeptidase